jgi:oligopeptide/dipeptide ABC transporter ATP-binding protein
MQDLHARDSFHPGVVLDVRNLDVVFTSDAGTIKAADSVSFELTSGRTLGLVGESGCGKSVTALSLLGLVPPPGRVAGGEILLDGTDLVGLPDVALQTVRGVRLSMIFQEPMTSLNPVISVGNQIAEVLEIHQLASDSEARARAVAMLGKVGIPDAAERARSFPHQMSGGMRQRVMIAMALVCRPGVLIADEPTTALDVTIQAQILDLMLDMQRDMGTAILFISHDLAVVSEIADDVLVMYAGRIVEQAPASSLFAAPLHPYTRGLIETLPTAGPRQDRLPVIPGTVPDLRALPPGCRFSDRCPLADEQCRTAEPRLERLGDGRRVACFKATP